MWEHPQSLCEPLQAVGISSVTVGTLTSSGSLLSHCGTTLVTFETPLATHKRNLDILDNFGHQSVPTQQPFGSPYYTDRDIWTSFSPSFSKFKKYYYIDF